MPRGYDDPFADAPAWQGGLESRISSAVANPAERSLPGLQDEERLPWLDAGDDAEIGGNPARAWALLVAAVSLLVVIAAGGWWLTHRADHAQLADGSLISAPPGPIKEAPQDPGGKTFDGTGDSSFAVSQGHSPGSSLAGGSDHADDLAPTSAATISAATAGDSAGAANPAGAIGVQLGAYPTQLAAEAAWAHLAKTFDALASVGHRVVAGEADIGTVYRLQAVAGSDGTATVLCTRLKTAGLDCQVQD